MATTLAPRLHRDPSLLLWLFALLAASILHAKRGQALTMPKKKSKHYAVARGRVTGIFDTWDACKAQITGFGGAVFKSFLTREEAEQFIIAHGSVGGVANSPAGPVRKKRKVEKAGSSSGVDGLGPVPAVAAALGGGVGDGAPPPPPPDPHVPLLRICLNFDGGARGNPGLGGAGAVVVSSASYPERAGDPVVSTWRVRSFCGEKCTNNAAEYTGMLEGLRCAYGEAAKFVAGCKRRRSDDSFAVAAAAAGARDGRWRVDVLVKGDSNLIIRQMTGVNAVKSPNLKPYYEKCKIIVGQLKEMETVDCQVNVTFCHVYREENTVADALANEAMDQKRSWTTVESNQYAASEGTRGGVASRECQIKGFDEYTEDV